MANMPILEYDLRPTLGHRADLRHLIQGLAVVLHQTPDVLRVVRLCKLIQPGGIETPPGMVVAEFLRSIDGQYDDDILSGGVRYATRSGVKLVAHYEDAGPITLAHDLNDVYHRFLNVPRVVDRPEVRQLIRNRITKYLS